MAKDVLIESVNENLRDTHTTPQKDSAEAKKMGEGAHIKALERKTEKKNNWMPHKSTLDETEMSSSTLEKVNRAGCLTTEPIPNEAEETKPQVT